MSWKTLTVIVEQLHSWQSSFAACRHAEEAILSLIKMKTKCYWLLVGEINLVDIQIILEYDTLEIADDFVHCFSGECSSKTFILH